MRATRPPSYGSYPRSTYVELATADADYIVNFYNPLCRHSSIDYCASDEFEGLSLDQPPARTLMDEGR